MWINDQSSHNPLSWPKGDDTWVCAADHAVSFCFSHSQWPLLLATVGSSLINLCWACRGMPYNGACHIDPPTHLHSILSLSFYNLGSQFLPFISLLDGILPMDCQFNNEDILAGTGPEDQILAQVGDCDFSWKGECFVKVSPHFLIHNYAVSSEFLPFTGLKSAWCLLEDF